MCGDLTAIPDLETLRARRLEAWAYTVLPPTHPFKAQLKPAFLQARARHELIKQEVLELVRAWNAAGIIPVIYKGFALSEFVYDQPGARFHGDVDVLVRPEEFERALEVGQAHGWHVPAGQLLWVGVQNHELSLKREHSHAAFDVHQRLVPSLLGTVQRETRLTYMAWQASTLHTWQDVQVRLLAPEDAFLFGLMVSRFYSGDGWQLKSHDLLDGLALRKKSGLRIQVLQARAKELGLQRTLGLFLERCDPFGPHLELRRITHIQAWRFEFSTMREHVPLNVMRLILITSSLRELLFAWRFLAHLRSRLKINPTAINPTAINPTAIKASLENLTTLEIPANLKIGLLLRSLWQVARFTGQTLGLAWPIAVFATLKTRGFQPVFVLGELNAVRRVWVELEGQPMPGFDLIIPDWSAYQVLYRHGIPLETSSNATDLSE